jgi:hypothetical protein
MSNEMMAHERRRRFSSDMGVWPHIHETVLHCPLCGLDYLHQKDVVVFQRKKEDGEVAVTEVKKGELRQAVRSDGPGRRDALLIYFVCENCPKTEHDPIVLEIIQHKGQTHVSWDRDRD